MGRSCIVVLIAGLAIACVLSWAIALALSFLRRRLPGRGVSALGLALAVLALAVLAVGVCGRTGGEPTGVAAGRAEPGRQEHHQGQLGQLRGLEGQPGDAEPAGGAVDPSAQTGHQQGPQQQQGGEYVVDPALQDYVSRELLDGMLAHKEEHIDWLETQMDLIDRVGLENYQQTQMG